MSHTDILLTASNLPFITLQESKIPNTWYHDKSDNLFVLSKEGFKCIKGSKKVLQNKK